MTNSKIFDIYLLYRRLANGRTLMPLSPMDSFTYD